jgi:Helix-turn-helix of DDE superfamily endonuclease
VLVDPSGIDLSSSALRFLSRLLAARRRERGTRWRRLPAGRQALLVLAHLRCGHTCAQLTAGFGVGTATVYRYVTEAVGLLAELAPDLTAAVRALGEQAIATLETWRLLRKLSMQHHPHHQPRPSGPHPPPDLHELRMKNAH